MQYFAVKLELKYQVIRTENVMFLDLMSVIVTILKTNFFSHRSSFLGVWTITLIKRNITVYFAICRQSAVYNGLKLNPKKSQVILIRRRGGDVPQPELFIGPDSIEMVPKVRNLGFVLNARGSL
jgi:hypothetical protein